MKMIRRRIYQIIEKSEGNDNPSLIFDWFIIILIVINVAAVILESFASISMKYSDELQLLETISVIIFSIELILRLITADYKYSNYSRVVSIVKYILSFMFIIDFLAILPFYLPLLIVIDLRFLRVLRLTRILRVLKVQRYSRSLNLIGSVFKKKKYDLIITLFVTFILLLLASSVMYYVENNSQPESFPNIIASFWWAIATLTTVGYGDVYPVTILGKILSGIIALLGIGIVALPTGIISSGFTEVLESTKKDKNNYCSNCGHKHN